eukprot:scaffold18260_cov57-Phaeocystis_antarctica.AAC.2
MLNMLVTLEVSKLSGWLNADARCRESKGGHAARCEGAGQQTGVTASSEQWRLNCRFGAVTGVERTRNISCMLVTLEVSKLSGWLNADAYCRGSKGGHVRYGTMCGPADGRRQAAGDRGARSVQGRGLDCRLGVGHGEERTENI